MCGRAAGRSHRRWITDSPTVKARTPSAGTARGYDAGKTINGRKRFIITDTLGLLVTGSVLAASWQNRDDERHPAVSEALIRWAAIAGMTRRITRQRPPNNGVTCPCRNGRLG
ncbi:transposase [Micromonospora sp. HM5-17]|uniref:transposase n=1 Tax=Micromonospora sp. HM5-17 TaxID=2487710 RepID=UPI003516252B